MKRDVKRDFAALERRRRKAMRLLQRGMPQVEVAWLCGVSKPTVSRWNKVRKARGRKPWLRRPLGRPPKLTPSQARRLRPVLLGNPHAHGYESPVWTSSAAAEIIRKLTGVRMHPANAWRLLRLFRSSAKAAKRRCGA